MDVKIRIKKNICFRYLTIIVFAIVSEYMVPNQVLYQKIVWVVYSIIAIIFILLNQKKYIITQVQTIVIICVLPLIAIIGYTAIVRAFYENNYSIIMQSFTTCMFIITDILCAATFIFIFRDKAIDAIFYSTVISYIIGLTIVVGKYGIAATIQDYIDSLSGLNSQIERNDIGTSVVILVMYYIWILIFKLKKDKEHPLMKIILLLVICILCGKRSAIIGGIVGLIVVFLIKLGFRFTKKGIFLLSCLIITGLFGYLYIIKSGILYMLSIKYDIDSMGRIYVWKWFNDLYSLLPTYLGRGFQFVHIYMDNFTLDGMVHDFGYMHNTILQLYIELGFYGFILYFFYNFTIVTFKINKIFGGLYVLFYLSIYITTVIIYMTDNVLTYPVYQTTLYVSIFSFGLFVMHKKQGDNNESKCHCSGV